MSEKIDREKRQKILNVLKSVSFGLAYLLLLTLFISFIWIARERNKAIAEREEKEKQKQIALAIIDSAIQKGSFDVSEVINLSDYFKDSEKLFNEEDLFDLSKELLLIFLFF